MKLSKSVKLLIAAIVIQFIIMVSSFLYSLTPLWLGQEVKLESRPIDPRSLLRGNYVRLNYRFNNLNEHNCDEIESLKPGDFVYAKLELNDEGLYRFSKAQKEKPQEGTFIRGTIQRKRYNSIGVTYGIEAYFLPKKEAKTMEKDMRRGGIIVLSILDSGRATLKTIEPKEEQ